VEETNGPGAGCTAEPGREALERCKICADGGGRKGSIQQDAFKGGEPT